MMTAEVCWRHGISPATFECRHDYNHYRPYSSLGNMTRAEMAAKSDGKPGWGLTPNPVVAFTPSPGQQNGQGLYL